MGIRKIKSGRNKGQYQIDWRDEYRTRQRLLVGYNYTAAENILHKKLTERVEKRTLEVRRGDKYTFKQVTVFYRAENEGKKASLSTDAGKIRLFNAFFGNRKIGDIPNELCGEYALTRKKIVSGSTVNREMTILKTIFEYAIDNGWLDRNPVRKWKEYEEPAAPSRVVEWGEYRQLLASVESLLQVGGKVWRRKFHLNQFRQIIPLGFECGGRREEIIRIKWDDLDWANRLVRFTYRKGKRAEWKERWVPMSDFVYETLKSISQNPDSPYVFPDERGMLWRSKISFYRIWHKILDHARLVGVGFHTLRHSYASHLANNNVDTETRMELLGHTSVTTQLRYTHMASERKRKAAEVMNKLASSQSTLDGRSLDTQASGVREEKNI